MSSSDSSFSSVSILQGPTVVGSTLSLMLPCAAPGRIDITVSSHLGRGAHALVLKGEPDGLGGLSVALKFPRMILKSIKLLKRELATWKMLHHPNVLPLLGHSDDDDSQPVLVSPWIKNGSMLNFLNVNPDANRIPLIYQVALGLRYLHTSAKLVHGDLKCENVLVTEAGDALICDFGLSTIIEKTSDEATTETSIRGLSTLSFCAPELLVDVAYDESPSDGRCPRKRSKTAKSDIYAYGMLILQAFTGRSPWHAESNSVQLYSRILRGVKPRHPGMAAERLGLDDDLWTLCCRCWELLPKSRPSSSRVVSAMNRRPDCTPPLMERGEWAYTGSRIAWVPSNARASPASQIPSRESSPQSLAGGRFSDSDLTDSAPDPETSQPVHKRLEILNWLWVEGFRICPTAFVRNNRPV